MTISRIKQTKLHTRTLNHLICHVSERCIVYTVMATDPDNTWLSATGGWGAAAGANVMVGAGYLSSGFATGVKTAGAQTPEGWKSAATAAMSGGAAAQDLRPESRL